MSPRQKGSDRCALREFLAGRDDAKSVLRTQTDQARTFVYWAVTVRGHAAVSKNFVQRCFAWADLTPPKNIHELFARLARTRDVVHTTKGYRPSAPLQARMNARLKLSPSMREAEPLLQILLRRVQTPSSRDFLEEAIVSLQANAPRAAVVMTWIVTMDHMFQHILKHKLPDFNAALAKAARPPIAQARSRDDFLELRESQFIELCRSSSVITKDMKKILDEKLGIRNTAAHPSGIKVHERKVVNFIEDLVENVILKLPA